MIVVVIETAVLCILFTVFVHVISREPIKTLYNYPPKIQERVRSLEMYKDQIPTENNKIAAKLTASVLMIVIISLVMKFVNGYDTFLDSFICSFIIWSIINWYDAIVLDCLWFYHSTQFVFEGTEDMVDEYHNYWFHVKGALLGELIGLFVCIVSGIIVVML